MLAVELPIYLKPGDVALLLRKTRKAIFVMIERGQLPGVKRVRRRLRGVNYFRR
jgi:hypothetical protein